MEFTGGNVHTQKLKEKSIDSWGK